MSKYYSQNAADFVAWIHSLVIGGDYTLLPCKNSENNGIHGKLLLGYYDEKNVYLIPDTLFEVAGTFLTEHKTNIKELESDLFMMKLIITEVDGVKLRYRKQKRIGKTKMRYLTFPTTVLFSKEECEKLFLQ